jgi:hypothetical protein
MTERLTAVDTGIPVIVKTYRRWAHNEQKFLVSAFVSLEPHDINNNAEFRVLNAQLTNIGYMTNGQQTLIFQLPF